MLQKILRSYRSFGVSGVVDAGYHQLVPRRAQCLPMARELLCDAVGLEIGGPSPAFRDTGILPLYPQIKCLDNCNFSHSTTWEGNISTGDTYRYSELQPCGRQYVLEASNLRAIPTASYDFVLSSHCLEHLANPIRGLHEWLRVIRDDGVLILLLPHMEQTFDHHRPVTSMNHLLEDFSSEVEEDDLTHLEEILKLHDLEMDPGAVSREDFENRSRDNYSNRCLHQHVFDNSLVVELLSQLQLQIHALENVLPFHIVVIAQKLQKNSRPDNTLFAQGGTAHWI